MRATRSGRTGLDPVARLPRRQTVVRAAAAALLLSIAAAVAWHGPEPPGTLAAAPPPASAGSTPTVPASPAALSTPDPVSGPGAAAPALVPPAPAATGGGSRLAVPAGMVGVPVPLGTPAATAMLEPGDRVDLLLLVGTAPPVTVAEACPVLDVDRMEAALMLALTPAQAEQVVAAPTSTRFAVIVRSTPVTSGG